MNDEYPNRDEPEPSKHSEQNRRSEPSAHSESEREARPEQKAGSGQKEGKYVFLEPADEKELRRVVLARGGYESVSHLLRDFLSRSLLPRISEGNYFPGRLLAETAGRRSARGHSRTRTQLRLEDWDPVAVAVCTLRRDLRRLEEQRVWKGGAGAFPFYRCGLAEVVRAAAREIGTWSRGGPPELFSQEEAAQWSGPGGEVGTEPGGEPRKPDVDVGSASSGDSSRGATYQKFAKLPGRDRGGKQVAYFITDEAGARLEDKGARLNQTKSALARRGTRLLVSWVEEEPAEAYQYISRESDLYEGRRDGSSSELQVYIAVNTKRRVEQAKARLGRMPGYGAAADEKSILQAAARLALELRDEKMRPPLPGAPTGR